MGYYGLHDRWCTSHFKMHNSFMLWNGKLNADKMLELAKEEAPKLKNVDKNFVSLILNAKVEDLEIKLLHAPLYYVKGNYFYREHGEVFVKQYDSFMYKNVPDALNIDNFSFRFLKENDYSEVCSDDDKPGDLYRRDCVYDSEWEIKEAFMKKHHLYGDNTSFSITSVFVYYVPIIKAEISFKGKKYQIYANGYVKGWQYNVKMFYPLSPEVIKANEEKEAKKQADAQKFYKTTLLTTGVPFVFCVLAWLLGSVLFWALRGKLQLDFPTWIANIIAFAGLQGILYFVFKLKTPFFDVIKNKKEIVKARLSGKKVDIDYTDWVFPTIYVLATIGILIIAFLIAFTA